MQARRIRPDTRPHGRSPPRRGGPVGHPPRTRPAVQRPAALAALLPDPVAGRAARRAHARVQLQSPARLAAWVVSPQVLGVLMALNVRRPRVAARSRSARPSSTRAGPGRPAGSGSSASSSIALVVVVPHLVIYRYGTVLGETFDRIFTSAVLGAVDDREGAERARPRATASGSTSCWSGSTSAASADAILTDTMMVASIDPVGHTVSLVSLPRDLIDTPLGDGDVVRPEAELPAGLRGQPPEGVPEGRDADAPGRGRGAARDPDPLLRPARLPRVHQDGRRGRRRGHRRAARLRGPEVRRLRRAQKGFSITAGPHHLDGAEALAYARSRKARRRERLHATGTAAADPRRAAGPGRPAAAACSSSSPTCSTRSAGRSGPISRPSGCPTSPRSSTRSARTT